MSVRFGCVVLVDERGWVLLQERDEHAPIAPDRWGFSGGHLEEGETYLEGALRELEEETGVRLGPDEVEEVGVFDVHHVETATDDTLALYAAATTLTDADIECNEGRRIVFVDPDEALGLPLTDSSGAVLPVFLGSDLYRRLSEGDRV